MKPPERHRWRRSGGFIVNFEQIFTSCSRASIVDFEHGNAGCVIC